MPTIKRCVAEFWSLVNEVFDGLWIFVHNGFVVRRAFLLFMCYVTFEAYSWVFSLPLKDMSIDVAAVIAAVMTPLSALQAATLKFYNDGRKDHVKEEHDVTKPSDGES